MNNVDRKSQADRRYVTHGEKYGKPLVKRGI